MTEVVYKDGKRPINLCELDRAIEMLTVLKEQMREGRLAYDRGDLSFEFAQDIVQVMEFGSTPFGPKRLRIHGDIEYLLEEPQSEVNKA